MIYDELNEVRTQLEVLETLFFWFSPEGELPDGFGRGIALLLITLTNELKELTEEYYIEIKQSDDLKRKENPN